MFKSRFPLMLGIAAFLCSCGTANRVASSFQHRKYRHGYYFDGQTNLRKMELLGNSELMAKHNITNEDKIRWMPAERHNASEQKNTKALLSSACNNHKTTALKPYPKALAPAEAQAPAGSNFNIIISASPDTDDLDSLEMAKRDLNYLSVASCTFSASGAFITLLEHTLFLSALTWGAIILMSLGLIVGILSLFSNRYYLNWMAVVGFGIIAALFLLVLL